MAPHRVSPRENSIEFKPIHQCGSVVGAVDQSERTSDSHPPAMTAMVHDQHPIVLRERREGGAPVEKSRPSAFVFL
jgi:hypothetical protein